MFINSTSNNRFTCLIGFLYQFKEKPMPQILYKHIALKKRRRRVSLQVDAIILCNRYEKFEEICAPARQIATNKVLQRFFNLLK